MAVTGIWKVESRLDKVIDYIINDEKTTNELYGKTYTNLHKLMNYTEEDYKTEKQCYVSGINCMVETAHREMQITKEQYNKCGGIQGFHLVQSFKEGEVTPEIAHEIGVKLAEELFGDRFEVIVATHLNTNHYHNHILLNSVSFKDGKRYYDNHSTYALIRKTSDQLCEEYGLSVIEEKNKQTKIDYDKIYKGHVANGAYYQTTKEDIDRAIKQAYSYKDFINLLKAMDYDVFFRAGKISLRRAPYKRNIRIERAFGIDYSIPNIQTRIMNEHEPRIPFIEEYSRAKKNYRGSKISSKKKASGIYKLYLHYCYLLKVFPKRYPSKYVPPSIRADVKKMERISNEARLLSRNNIKTTEQLFLYMDNLSEELSNLKAKREDCYIKLKKSDTQTKELIQNKITNLTEKINIIKAERGMCREICERIPIMKDNVKEMYAKENNEGRKKEHERTK